MKNPKLVGGEIGESENMSLGLNLFTGEAFNMTVDLKKGSNLETSPDWMHGLGMEALEQTRLEANLSRMPAFTATSRGPPLELESPSPLSSPLLLSSLIQAVFPLW